MIILFTSNIKNFNAIAKLTKAHVNAQVNDKFYSKKVNSIMYGWIKLRKIMNH